jgi:hypothetical protein
VDPDKDYERNYQHLAELLGGRDHVRIENGRYLPLVVERLWDDQISLCHYGEMNGDPMRDPEVVFLVEGDKARPGYYRNDYAAFEQATVPGRFGYVPVKEAGQKGLDRFVSEWWTNIREQGFFEAATKTNKASSHDTDPAASQAVPAPARKTAATETTMTETSNTRDLCFFESGPFTAVLRGQFNPESETWTYRTSIFRDNQEILQPMLKHDIAGARAILATGAGAAWLSDRQIAKGIEECIANAQVVSDLENALKVSEVLIQRFAERGHEAALQDKRLSEEVGLEAQGHQAVKELTRAPSRER